MSETHIVGKVAMTFRGAYDANASYEKLDVITYNGTSYGVLQACTGVTPPNDTYYQVLAQKGTDGQNGSAATVAAGTVTMLPVGSSATVSNSGTSSNAIFNFGIPKESFDTSIIAEDFNSASAYVAGDYCVYNGSLYRFTADKSAGSWNSSVVEQVAVCVELNNRLEKSEFNRVNTNGSTNYAGIHSETYVTELNTTSVTTASLSGYPSYVATILEQDNPDALYRGYMYRITFDGVEYILPCLEWFIAVHVGTQFVSSTFPIIGNVTLFNSSAGFYTENANVPFLISGLISTDSNPKDEGIFLFTQTSGAHTVKIERIEYAYTMLPEYTMYGATIRPIYRQKDNNTAYPVFSIGTNNLENRRNCFAIGNCNTISSSGYMAIGSANTVSGNGAIAMGTFNTASGQYSRTFGAQSTASGNYAESHGAATTASGQMSTTHGYRTTANHKAQFVFGEFNTPDPSTATASSRGNYVEIVGNGTAVGSTSNARTLDWQGNESLAGGLTLGMGTANEVSITAQQLQQLLALLN